MLEWLNSVAGPEYAPAILWTGVALVLLVVLLLIIKLIRSLTFGTFVAGGRNRKTRLAVMDATAVDSHRRLVLVRRDDIEHLLLIGGPTDVVVERDIRLSAPRRPAMTGEGGQQAAQARPRPPQAPASGQTRAPQPAAAAQPAPPARSSAPAPASRSAQQKYAAAPSQPALPAYGGGTTPAVRQAPSPRRDDIDDELMRELEVSLDEPPPPKKPVLKAQPPSLDDEMTKLLGELSSHKR